MSWSLTMIGKPSNIAKALDAHGAKLTDPNTKEEFNEVLPSLKGVVTQNSDEKMVKLDASGHGWKEDGQWKSKNFSCTIQPLYGELVDLQIAQE